MERTYQSKIYETNNIDLGTTIYVVTGVDPEISFIDGNGIATLKFPITQAIAAVVMRYESANGIRADARKLLTARNQLYKRVRRERRL